MAQRRDSFSYLSGEDFTEDMRETGRFTYRNEEGRPRFQVRRRETQDGKFKKCPVYRHRNINGFDDDAEMNWERGSEDNKIHKEEISWPYNLRALLELPKDQIAYVAEGEPCVDSMLDLGFTAVCNMFGAQAGSWLKEYSRFFDGREVACIFADADLPGRRHANAIRHSLRDSVKHVIVISFPEYGLGADIRDIIKKEGPNRATEIVNERVERELALLKILKSEFPHPLIAEYCKQYKLGKREAASQIKAAKESIIQGDKDAFFYYAGERDAQGRIMLPIPAKDARMTETVVLLDNIMTTDESEPPMRAMGTDPTPVRVAECEVIGLHQLTHMPDDVTREEISALPKPKLSLVTRHTQSSMQMLIEKYVWHYKLIEKDDCVERAPVQPHLSIVTGLMEFTESKWPQIKGVNSAPLVLPNGEIVTKNGLHRDLQMVFRIDEELRRLLPTKRPTDAEIRKAIKWLFDNWLCDVLTDNDGRYTTLALCLSILERTLLPDRPVFWAWAGKRGGGKTTLLNMVSMAVLGTRAPATAWSDNEDERRKSLFAAARQGVPFIVFDNLPKKDISCPHVEKFSTAETYSDRVLKESTQETVPATAIIAFTGNNVQPIGDLSSRSLIIHIIVKDPHPEDRAVKHIDPVSWTFDNRGKILQCLFTILLGNPRLYAPADQFEQAKTRFKEWYFLVGSPIEYAAQLMGHDVNFSTMFHKTEEDDDSVISLAETLDALRNKFGVGNKNRFSAKKVCEMLEEKSQGNEYSNRAQTLRAYMTDEFGNVMTDTQRVGIRLKHMVENPIMFGEETLTLVSGRDNVTNTRYYWVDGPEKF